MSKDAKNVPALRFKGYSDAWEKRKLREITEINPKGKIPEVFRYVDLESVKNSSIISSKIETKQTAPSRAQRTAEIGDVFYQTVRPYQKNNVIFLLHSSMPYVFSTGYAQLRSNMNSFFILYLVQTDGFVNDVLNRATGTSYPAINPTHLATIIVCFPKIVSEQNRIGQVLEHLDNLITATQHKIDALEQAKKALLQRLFDQSWRFKGYSDPWEKRKLREITEINPKGKIPEVFRYVDLESVKNSSIISSKIETKQTAPSRAQRTAEIGDVFYQTVRPYQKNNVIFLLHSSMPYVFSTGYAQLRSNMNSFFILYLVQTDGFVNDVLNRATGTSYPAINPTHLATIIVCFPKIVSEQNRIGQVLEHLDNLITATQSRLSSLELLKKALLQDLFI